jgi:ParB family chromosome partitioning protein
MQRRLGRGLDSLLAPAPEASGLRELGLNEISTNPFQPRRNIDPVALEELRDSIRQHGVLQPVVVRAVDSGFQLIAGERRWRAARLAGLESIPAQVREDVTDDMMLELALVENVQRRDLDPIERARGFRSLIDRLGVTQEAVAAKVGLRRTTVTNHLRLLELPQAAQDALSKGLITMGHARAMLGLPSESLLLRVLETAIRKELSVRDIERMVREESRADGATIARRTGEGDREVERPAWITEAERRLSGSLRVEVRIDPGSGESGRVILAYHSHGEITALLNRLAPRPAVA